ncbi:MAG: hypothetical protein EOO61_01305 [Hymenobacter sp.]|nr:MAG: hypothetical protein EOO61_01305 [Hymenobacter sp.]
MNTLLDFVREKAAIANETGYRKMDARPNEYYPHDWKQADYYEAVADFLYVGEYRACYDGVDLGFHKLKWLNKYDALLRRRKLRLLIGT